MLSLNEQAADWLLRMEEAPDNASLQAGLHAWLAEEEQHRKAYARACKVWALAAALPAQPAPEVGAPTPRARRHRRWVSGLAAAAVALVALGAGQLLPEHADYTTGTAEKKQVHLGDGTVVTLDTDSAISVAFSERRRQVRLLHGQAFFEVAHNPARPFDVIAAPLTVTVTGTAFNVQKTAAESRVVVESGAVQVAEEPYAPVALHRGEGAVADAGGLRQLAISTEPIAPWRKGRLVVNGQPIAAVAQALGRYVPGKVLLLDSALGRRTVTGIYDVTQPEQALQAMLQPHHGRLRRLSPYLLLIDSE